MTIGIVLAPFDEREPGGLARTIFEWAKALIEGDIENEYIVYVKKQPSRPPAFLGTNWRLEVVGGGFFWHERLRFCTRADVYLFQTPILPITFSPPAVVIIQ